MQHALCTITTESHLFKVMALADSVRAFMPELPVHVLVTDQQADRVPAEWQRPGIHFHGLETVGAEGMGKRMLRAYGHDPDRLRWCMKPVFLRYLLDQGIQQLLYLDNDIYFFSSPDFLFDLLTQHAVLLSPHWRTLDPRKDPVEFRVNFLDGLYNGGFFGAAEAARPALDWWAEVCLYRCVQDRASGFWDDQRYLDLLPVRFERVHVLQHQGCNVAVWNRHDLKRVPGEAGVMINGKWPLVFIHFTDQLFENILEDGMEQVLRPHTEAYLKALRKYQPEFIPNRLPKSWLQRRILKYKYVLRWYGRGIRRFFSGGRP